MTEKKKTVVVYYGTGRRKEAVAKVWLKPGKGKITVNDRPYKEYFVKRSGLELAVTLPLTLTKTDGQYDVTAQALGGGMVGQAGAVSLGVARALLQLNPDFRLILKREGLLRRDPRMRERKKYGRKRARRAFQFTKR